MKNDLVEILKHFYVYDKDTISNHFQHQTRTGRRQIINSFQESQKAEFEAYKQILSISEQ